MSSRALLSSDGHSLGDALRVFHRRGGGMMMQQPSSSSGQSSNWAFSKPVVIIDILWNLAYLFTALVVLFSSTEERPQMPLRLWIVGYSSLCLLHVACIVAQYRASTRPPPEASTGYVTLAELTPPRTPRNITKYLDSANTMLSFCWWVIGFYWVCTGGQQMVQESPQLYWLCIVFLAFDVFFVVFLIVLAGAIGLGICCCLPCIIAVLYTVTEQKGAEREDIEQLSKYIFHGNGGNDHLTDDIQRTFAGFLTQCGTDTPIEHSVSLDDAECSICLSAYSNGDELRELPCEHHFHCTCIDKWLHMSATCPLCKQSIFRDSSCSADI